MKDVEKLLKRLGTQASYQEYGQTAPEEIREKWPLMRDLHTASPRLLARDNAACNPVDMPPLAELPPLGDNPASAADMLGGAISPTQQPSRKVQAPKVQPTATIAVARNAEPVVSKPVAAPVGGLLAAPKVEVGTSRMPIKTGFASPEQTEPASGRVRDFFTARNNPASEPEPKRSGLFPAGFGGNSKKGKV